MNSTTYYECLAKLEELRKLPRGWCYGHEEPPTRDSIQHALTWITRCFAYDLEIDLLPTDDGGIEIIALRGDLSLTITIRGEHIVSYSEEKGIGFSYNTLEERDFPGQQVTVLRHQKQGKRENIGTVRQKTQTTCQFP